MALNFSGGGSLSVEDEGIPIASASTLDFIGAGINAVDAGGGKVTVTVAPGAAPVASVNGKVGIVALNEDDVNSGNGTIVASATTNIGAQQQNRLDVTGTATITSFGVITAGIERTLIFSASLTLTHNAVSLILPTNANITPVAGDTLNIISLGAGNWKVINFQRADGTPLVDSATGDIVGPGVSTLDDIFTFADTTGKVAKDSGINISAVVANTAKVSNANHTGEVTGATALTIAPGAVTLPKMADISTASFIGRNTVGIGVPEVLSATTARTILNVEDGSTADQTNVEIESAYNAQVALATQTEAREGLLTTVKRWTPELVRQVVKSDWGIIPVANYTALPASTSTLNMSDTSDFVVGIPIRYVTSAGIFFARIDNIVTNTSISIQGAAFVIGGTENLTELAVGHWGLVQHVEMFVSGNWADGVDLTLLKTDMKSRKVWRFEAAYLVGYSAVQDTPDTGIEGKLNVTVNGNPVSTNDTNNGIQLGLTDAIIENPAIAINKTNYKILRNQFLDLNTTVPGGSADGSDLTVEATFILEGN